MADPNEVGGNGWVVDPKNPNRATYTDESGQTYEITRPAPAQPTAPSQPRSGWERFTDSIAQSSQEGFGGQVAQAWYDLTDAMKPELRKKFPGRPDDWYEQASDRIISESRKAVIDEYAAKQAADPNWQPDESFLSAVSTPSKWVPWFAGQLVGGAGPESLVNPGGSALRRVAAQGAIGGATDVGYQGANMAEGVREEYDPLQSVTATVAASGLQGAFEIPGFVRNLFKSRGVDTTPGADPRVGPDGKAVADGPEVEVGYADTLDPREYSLDELAKIEQSGEWAINPEDGLYHRIEQDSTQAAARQEAEALFARPEEIAAPEVPQPTISKGSERRQAAVDETKIQIAELTRDWENGPQFEVIGSVKELPRDIRKAMPSDAIGAYLPDGRVVINLKNAKTPEVVQAVVFHEGLGHHGLAQKFNEDLDRVLEDLYYNSKGSFKQEVDDWLGRNPDTYSGNLARAAEEVLAEMSEAGRISPSMMAKLRNWLKDFGRSMGLDLKYSDGEIRTILGMAHSATVSGAPSAGANGFRYKSDDELIQQRREMSKAATAKLNTTEPGKTQTVQPFPEQEPDYWRFQHKTEDGKTVSGYYTVEDGKLDNFSIDAPGGARSIGPRAIRQIGRDLLSQHPEASRISGYRLSGARADEQFVESGMKFARKAEDEEGTPRVGALNPSKIKTVADIDDYLYELQAVNPNRKTTWAETEAEAQARGLTPSRIAKRRGADGLSSYLRAANQALTDQLEKVASLEKKLTEEGYSVQRHEQLLQAMATLKAVHARVNYDNSEVGRALNILRMATESKDKAKLLEGVDLNLLSDPEQFMKFMTQLSEQLASGNTDGAIRMAADAFNPKAEDFIFSLYYNMLLSNPGTHGANFAGTGLNFMYDLLENTGAAVTGQFKRFSNADRVRAREVMYRVYGALAAMKSASTYRNMRESLNTGLTGGVSNSKTTTGSDIGAISTALGKVAGKPGEAIGGFIEASSRALAGADEWWRNVIQLSSLYGLAVRNAGNKGLKGKEFWNEVNDLIAKPTKEMIDATNDYSKVIQFLDKPSGLAKTIIGLTAPKVGDRPEVRVGRGLLRTVVPFVRTPDALIRTSIRRGLGGPLSYLERENIKGWKAGGAERDKVKARLIMGSVLSFYVAAQAYNGNITGEGPTDYKKRAEWEGTHQPNSIKIGDEWVSIQGLEPISTNLTGIATLVERRKAGEISQDDYLKSSLSLAQGMGAILTQNSYTESLTTLPDVFSSSPDQAMTALTGFMSNIAASATTPAIVRKYNQTYVDQAERDTTGSGSIGDRIEGRVKAGVPGLSDDLPAKYDVYGRPQVREAIWGPDMFSRMQTETVSDDPPIQELSRLSELTDEVLVGRPSKSNIKVDGEVRKLTAEEFQDYQHLSGYWIVEAVRQQMGTPEWDTMSDAEKIGLVKEIRDEVRKAAREALFDPEDEETDTVEEDEE